MLESFITSLTPDILVSLFQQFSNWLRDLGEVWNELSIIVGQPKETSYPGHVVGGFHSKTTLTSLGSTMIPSGETT
jgi:hypothetical protein